MTIALGILASDGVVIAADAQENFGDFKTFALKVHSAMTQTAITSTVKSAVAVTGAGSAVYLDAIADEIIRRFHKHQDTDIPAFEAQLSGCIAEFYAKHVTPLPAHLSREIWLIVGAQIEGRSALWTTELSVVKSSLGFEAVGTGHSYARMAIQNRAINLNAEAAAILAVLGVTQAKEYDGYCGKGTTVIFLKDNVAHHVPWYLIRQAEELFEKYAGVEHSAFLYALGHESGDEAKRPRKVTRWLKSLRKEFIALRAQILQDSL